MPVYRIILAPYVVQAGSFREAANAVKDCLALENEVFIRSTSQVWEDQDDYIQETGGNIDIVVEEPQVAQE